MNYTPRFSFARTLAISAAIGFGFTASASAITVTTAPVGAMTYTIAPGTGTTRTTSSFVIPLTDTPLAAGKTKGLISALTSTSVTVTNAEWTPGALATPSAPYQLRITSGAAAGSCLSITNNTADTLTVSGYDPRLNAAAGDKFELIPVDTLDSLFGSNTLTGGPRSSTADIVYLGSNSQTGYYYNTNLQRWVLATGLPTNKGLVQIPFSASIRIARISKVTTQLTFVGAVPSTKFRTNILNSGNTFSHTGFPSPTTLGDLALNSKLPGWVSGKKAVADVISLPSGAGWVNYYHNGTNWVLVKGLASSKNSVTIPAGTPILISKKSKAPGISQFINEIPYTL